MRKRKAQGEIITTVLIILLVLAAIVIVWQVVRGTVSNTATSAGKVSDCIGVDLTLESATLSAANGATAVVRKGGAALPSPITGIRVIVSDANGVVSCNVEDKAHIPQPYGTAAAVSTCTPALVQNTAYNVKIAPILGNGNQCEPMGGVLNIVAGA